MAKGGRPAKRDQPDLFAALADPTRRELLERLAHGERTVGQLSAGLPVSQAAISQHLRLLRETGLVEVAQDGRFRRYRLRLDALDELRAWLEDLERFWTDRLGSLGTYLEKQ